MSNQSEYFLLHETFSLEPFCLLALIQNVVFAQIFQIAAHLVYWGKAIIIYPLCENNVYMLSPHAHICLWVSV